MKTLMIGLLLFCGITSSLFCSDGMNEGGRIHWYTNYQDAVYTAKNSSKPMLLLFTGSDWCGACKQLEHQVFASPNFSREMGNKVIFVMLDYPKGKPQDPEIKEQNAQLKRKYSIPHYPYIVLLDSNEKRLGTIESRAPGEFVRELQSKVQLRNN